MISDRSRRCIRRTYLLNHPRSPVRRLISSSVEAAPMKLIRQLKTTKPTLWLFETSCPSYPWDELMPDIFEGSANDKQRLCFADQA